MNKGYTKPYPVQVIDAIHRCMDFNENKKPSSSQKVQYEEDLLLLRLAASRNLRKGFRAEGPKVHFNSAKYSITFLYFLEFGYGNSRGILNLYLDVPKDEARYIAKIWGIDLEESKEIQLSSKTCITKWFRKQPPRPFIIA